MKKNWRKSQGSEYAFAMNSATSALHLAYLSLGVSSGDLVWTSPITFVATSNAALMCGANVDFVDIEESTLNMCPVKLEKKLKETVLEGRKLPKVVTPVHMCGNSCDMKKIGELAKKYSFKIIEDASHAIGGTFLGKPVGACEYSDITIFSFHPVKIVTTGEGGALLTNDPNVACKVKMLRSHGVTKENLSKKDEGGWYYEQHSLGFNYRMTDIQAALGISQLEKLGSFVKKRQKIVNKYIEFFNREKIDFVRVTKGSTSSNHLMIIKVNSGQRKKIFENFHSSGVAVQVHYFPVHLQPFYKNLGFRKGMFPKAEKVYEQIISLPLYFELRDSDFAKIKDLLKKLLKINNQRTSQESCL